MVKNFTVLFVVVFGLTVISNAFQLPKEFALCHRSDPNFKKCLSQAIQNSIQAIASGNKELQVPVLDHLKVSRINIENNGGPVDMTQYYTDCVLTGLTDATYTYAEAWFEKNKCYINCKAHIDVLIMSCQYAFKGKLLFVQLNGHGHSNTTLTNFNSWHNLTCEIYEKSGNEYLNITGWIENYTPKNVFYYFENLVHGNAEMSAQVLQVMNDNALEVFENLRADYQNIFAVIYKQLANNVFSKIPLKNIFLE